MCSRLWGFDSDTFSPPYVELHCLTLDQQDALISPALYLVQSMEVGPGEGPRRPKSARKHP